MKVYQANKLRNVAVVAHGGAGKTSLTEALIYNTGLTKRLGKVDEGNTITDYFPEEIGRKITINATLAPCEWRDVKINLIDTPGFADFFGDVQGALRVVDGLLAVFCAVSGVEVQSEVIWEYAAQQKLPRVAFINKMDRENADFYKAVEEMKSKLEGKIIPVQLPIGNADTFKGVVDILSRKAWTYENGKAEEIDIPVEMSDKLDSFRHELVEAIAENDDELLMAYLEGEEIPSEQLWQGLVKAVKTSEFVPVLCGSALNNIACDRVLEGLVELLPSAEEASGKTAAEMEKKPFEALVFKTLADPYVGKVSIFRVYNGTLRQDTPMFNINGDNEEKIGQLLILRGKEQIGVPELRAGDIGALTKLQSVLTGHTLSVKGQKEVLEGISFSSPSLTLAIRPKSKGDEDKLGNGLSRLLEEDPTIRVEKNLETHEMLLSGMGETHLDIITERLKSKFGVEVETSLPRIPYRETIKGKATRVEGKHKKQSGGHGQFGHVFIDVEPYENFVFEEKIFGGAVPRQYIPAVEKGIREAMTEGVLAGYPVANIRVNLIDGSYHSVDSSEMAFKIAATLAFRKAVEQSKPVLLEPLMNVEVKVPEQFMGDIMGDLNSKRGRVLGMESEGRYQIIKAQVPLAEMYRYAIDLKSITQGRGSFRMEFSQYEEVPANFADKIIEEAKAAKAAKSS